MPVTTRSQTKLNNSLAKQQPKVTKLTIPDIDKWRQIDEFRRWFCNTIAKMLDEIKCDNATRLLIKIDISKHSNTDSESNMLLLRYRQLYYDTLRRFTEMFYIIEEYYPEFHSRIDTYNFGKTVYDKIAQLYNECKSNYNSVYCKPESEEEHHIIKLLLNSFYDTEKMLIKYIPVKHQTRRLRKFVDYTGMIIKEP
jgi:hypothetical protein